MNKIKLKKNYHINRGGGYIGIGGATVAFSEPGSENDPLISLSYLESRLDQLKLYIDEKLEGTTNGVSTGMEVVEIKAGQSIIGRSGTEIILRGGGKATVIAGELGGLSDVTDGKDLKMSALVPPNHLLIIPRDDSRGAYALTDAIF